MYANLSKPCSLAPACPSLQGSITGACSAHTDTVVPSFVLLAIQENKLVCYVYELSGGEVEVSKTEFTKAATPEGSGANPSLMQTLLA